MFPNSIIQPNYFELHYLSLNVRFIYIFNHCTSTITKPGLNLGPLIYSKNLTAEVKPSHFLVAGITNTWHADANSKSNGPKIIKGLWIENFVNKIGSIRTLFGWFIIIRKKIKTYILRNKNFGFLMNKRKEALRPKPVYLKF